MSTWQLAIMLLVGLAAGTLHGACGFGYSILTIAIFPYLLPSVSQATALVSMTSTVTTLLVLIHAWRHIQYKIALPVVGTYMVSSAAVILLSVRQSNTLLTRALGAALILLSIYMFFWSGKIKIKPTLRNGMIFGFLGGIAGGLFALGAPVTVIYMLSSLPEKEEYRATINFHAAIANLWMSLVRGAAGIVTMEMMGWVGMLFVVLVAGIALGNRVFKRLDAATMRKIVYVVMAVSGLNMVLR